MSATYKVEFLFQAGSKDLKEEADIWIKKNFKLEDVEDGIRSGNGITKVYRRAKFLWWAWWSKDLAGMGDFTTRHVHDTYDTIAANHKAAIEGLYYDFLKYIKKMPVCW